MYYAILTCIDSNMFLYFQLHLVHLNKKYASLSDGLNNPDGLAVLGVLFKVRKTVNICVV